MEEIKMKTHSQQLKKGGEKWVKFSSLIDTQKSETKSRRRGINIRVWEVTTRTKIKNCYMKWPLEVKLEEERVKWETCFSFYAFLYLFDSLCYMQVLLTFKNKIYSSF